MPVRPAAARPEEPASVDDPSVAEPHDPSAAPASRRPLVAGAIAGAWSLLVGIAVVTCLVMLTWAVSPWSAGDAAAAWRAAGLTWLGAHQVPLQVGGDPLTLLPLGGLLLGLLLARRAGAWAGRLLPDPSPAEVARVAAGAGLLYGAGGAAIAWLSAAEGAFAVPARAALVSGLVAVVGVLWGIGPEAGLLARARQRVGDALWRTLAAGLAAVLGLVAVGALLVAVSLVRHFADARAALGALEAGVLGSAGLTLLDLLALPSLAVWAMAVVVGPGVRLGALGELSAFGGEVGSLPALPVLAAIPTSLPGWAPALLLVPVLMGVLAGRIRWGRDLPTPLGALTGALAVGAVVGGLLVVLGWATSGSLGAGRLGELGPPVWPVAAAGAGLVMLGFLLEAGAQLVRLSWELHRAEQRAAEQRAAEQPVGAAPDGVEATDRVEPVLAEIDPEAAAVTAQAAAPGRAGRLAGRAGAALGPAALGVRGVAAAIAGRVGGSAVPPTVEGSGAPGGDGKDPEAGPAAEAGVGAEDRVETEDRVAAEEGAGGDAGAATGEAPADVVAEAGADGADPVVDVRDPALAVDLRAAHEPGERPAGSGEPRDEIAAPPTAVADDDTDELPVVALAVPPASAEPAEGPGDPA